MNKRKSVTVKGISRKRIVGYTAVLTAILLTFSFFGTLLGAPTERTFTYQLAWQGELDEPVVTNLGYTIALETAYLSNGSLSLIPCEGESGDVVSWLAPQVAYAGHGDEADSSQWVGPLVEAPFAGELIPALEVGLGETAYCQLHYLVSPATAEAEIPNTALFLQGSYQTATDGEAIPFTVMTELAWGTIIDLSLAQQAQLGNDATVIVERPVATLFDDIDFGTTSANELGKVLLRQLLADTTVGVE